MPFDPASSVEQEQIDDATDERIGAERARAHKLLRLETERRASAHLCTQHVACTQLWNIERINEPRSLRALSRCRRPKQDDDRPAVGVGAW